MGGWVGLLRIALTRRRNMMTAVPATASSARCARYGAVVPVLVGSPMHCPFCSADLVPDDAAQSAAEAAVAEHVNELTARAMREAVETETSRATSLENAISMVTGVQLAVIGLGCVISLFVLASAIVNALAG